MKAGVTFSFSLEIEGYNGVTSKFNRGPTGGSVPVPGGSHCLEQQIPYGAADQLAVGFKVAQRIIKKL